MATQKNNLIRHILRLLENHTTINLKQIASTLGLSAENASNRRAIQRALSTLVDQGILTPQGEARAREYVPNTLRFAAQTVSIYKTELMREKNPIDYNPDFLNAYIPNKTYYLNETTRQQLMTLGRVDIYPHPAGTYARAILQRLLIDLSWNSSRLEGNTYSILETQRLLEFGEIARGKEAYEAHMILNHKSAIEYVVSLAEEENITALEARSIHALLSDNLLKDNKFCGKIREMPVYISGSQYRPASNPHLLQEYFNKSIEKFNQINDPFEQSFFALTHISYLQAFEDINKRTSRLMANIPLIKKNLRPLAFVNVKQAEYVHALLAVYEKNDVGLLCDWYRWAYEQSAEHYSIIVREPDIIKLRYFKLIKQIVNALVLRKIPGSRLHSEIKRFLAAERLSIFDNEHLQHAIEIEIIGLHEGNIARFKIRPEEFAQWQLTLRE